MITDTKNGIEELQNLGFTNLESEIYVHLLGAGASSGYAIAQAISKPAANVYKAINTLEKKGALLIDEGNTRLCHAVPAAELLNALQHVFDTNKNQVGQFLESIETDQANDKVFRLKDPEQVLEKCRHLLARAQHFVIIDAFPTALETLRSEITAAEKRGVQIAIHAYADIDLSGVREFPNPDGPKTMELFDGQWLNITIDAQNFIMAYFSSDMKRVSMAIWSTSPYISAVYHSALISELQLSEIKHKIDEMKDLDELRGMIKNLSQYFEKSFPVTSTVRKNPKFKR